MAAFLLDEEERLEGNVDQEPEQEIQQEQQQQEVDDIPEKYKNKSVKDIVRMHQEAEKLAGRHSSEIGELRKIVDDFVVSQTELKKDKKKPVDEVDFFTNPSEAVKALLDNDPRLKQAEDLNKQMTRSVAVNELQKKHPDMSDILNNPKFNEWIQGSNIRRRLYEQADKAFDHEAADELFTLWKERTQVVNQTVSAEKDKRTQQVKAAATGSSNGNVDSNSRKVYRRVDIIKLMRDDPNRYEALSNEIIRAYAEGRVKG